MRYPSPFSAEEEKFIEENIAGTPRRKMAEMLKEKFGTEHDVIQIKNFLSKKHLRSGVKPGYKEGEIWKVYPPEVRAFIKENHKGCGPTEMAKRIEEKFGISYTPKQLHAYYHNHGLTSGLTGQFEKGHVPWSKGKKLELNERQIASQFRPGHVPENAVPVGTILKKADGYLWRKISDEKGFSKNWKQEHILRWEEVNGPVPEKHCLIFLDGDRENVELSNLKLISRGELAVMTRLHLRSEDPEITETGLLIAKLCTAIYQKKKKTGGRKKE